MYNQMNIWNRISESEAVCYRIFKKMGHDIYFVQSKDFFKIPIDKTQLVNSEKQLIELFIEEDLSDRENGFNSIEAAISEFDKDFIS